MIGDDIFVTEETYLLKIGNLVVTIDLLVKRIGIKDNAINELQQKIEELETKLKVGRLASKEETKSV